MSIAAFIVFAFLLFMQTVGASLQQQQAHQQQPADLVSFVPIPIAFPLNIDSNKGTLTPISEVNSIPNNLSVTQAATCQKLAVPSATANGNDGNVPSNVLDNDPNTRWSNNGIGSWIQLDLGAKKSICSVDIAWHRGSEGRQNDFIIQWSSDGVNFSPSTPSPRTSSGTISSLERYAMPAGTEARYVKITVNGNNENDWASISEIAVFGGNPSTGGSSGGILYHKWQASPSSSNSWSAWVNIGSAINIRGEPVVAQNSGGRLEVFAVNAANNQLYHKWQNSPSSSDSWSAWVNIGSTITIRGTPIVAKNLDGRLEVFAVNAANNQLYHKWQTKAGDSNSWSAWEVLGLNVKSGTNPVIVSNKDGRLEVFAVNAANNQLYHKWQNSPNSSTSWSASVNIGSAITIRGDPVIAMNSDGRLEAFAVNPEASANKPPTADPKTVTTSMNTAKDITLTGKDPENGPLTFTVVKTPTNGKVANVPGAANTVKYTPNTGFTGSDSFTYTAKDNKDLVSGEATVTITVTSSGGGGGGGDAGQNDQFGLKKIYSSKPDGEKWFMDMQDPQNDPRSNPPDMTKITLDDGSTAWRVTDGQVRYGVYTSSGYHPDQVVKNHGTLATRGYMQSPNDWKNIEMTGQVRYNSGGDDEWTWYARGGRHTGSGSPEGCEGSAYKGSLAFTSGQVRWAKEQWHVSYVFQPWKDSPANGDGEFVGFKVVMYNTQLQTGGKTVVKLESYVDPNNNNQWQKVYDYIDQGGWGSEGGECQGASDQIITWGGPTATFRWDNGDSIDIRKLSVREIVPPSQ